MNKFFRRQLKMDPAAALVALRAAARECQLAAPNFSDEQAAQGLAITAELRARFLPPDASAQAAAQLLQLPASSCPSSCPALRLAISPASPQPADNFVVTRLHLRRCAQSGRWRRSFGGRAAARGLDVGSSLPDWATSWVACLLKHDRRDAQKRQALLAVGFAESVFVDKAGRLLVCGDPIGNPIEPPTPMPSMQDQRMVSVASKGYHFLALGVEGEVYAWGDGEYGSLGHGDEGYGEMPSRIESLSRIERIAVGPNLTSAAVDEDGRLFTWGRASFFEEQENDFGEVEDFEGPTGLGYELDVETEYQPTPRRVDALSQERVVGVALGLSFMLAVTEAGAVFSCGSCQHGGLGHGPLISVVLPLRIEALAETGRRFVAVAAGDYHALALTEGGEVYGWGDEEANGHGREEHTPQRVAALIGQRVKLVDAHGCASCAVMEEGELFTWGGYSRFGHLGHGVKVSQFEPLRVDGLSGVQVAAVAIGETHTLAADVDGVVWAFGQRSAFGLDAWGIKDAVVPKPTPIPTLRVRVLNSP